MIVWRQFKTRVWLPVRHQLDIKLAIIIIILTEQIWEHLIQKQITNDITKWNRQIEIKKHWKYIRIGHNISQIIGQQQ